MGSSVDEILRELGVTPSSADSKPANPTSSSSAENEDAELNALLNSIIGEKTAAEIGEKMRSNEPPTKVFTQRTKRYTSPKSMPAANPVQEPQSRSNLPPIFQNIPTKAKEPSSTDQTGKIQIDIDAIRAEQRPPQSIPAQDLSEPARQSSENEQPKLRPAEKVREMHHFQNPFDSSSQYAPPYRGFGKKLEHESPSVQMDQLRSASKLSLWTGILTFIISLILLGFVIAIQFQRVQSPPLMPTRITLGLMVALAAAAGGISWKMITTALVSFFKFEPNREILPVLTYLLCFLQAIGQLIFPKGILHVNVQLYIPAGVLLLAFAWFSRVTVFKTALINGKLVFSDFDKYIPQPITDTRLAAEFTRGLVDGYGIPVINRQTDLLGDFLPISFGSDRSDISGRNLGMTALLIGSAAALFTFLFTQQKNLALTVMTAIFLVFSPLTNLFCTAHPLRRSAKILNRVGALAAGERCTQDCAEVNAAVIDAKDLFPSSSVTLSGIKTFEGMRIDEAILDTASVLVQAGSILSDVFLKIISNRTDLLRQAESISFEDGLGISAWVGKKRVLIGNRELMIQNNIRVPSEDYEHRFREQGCDLVYLGSAGDLTAVFIITLRPSQEADMAIQRLLENDILLTVHTVDSIVTQQRLADLYLCETSCFKILPARLQEKFRERRTLVKLKPASLANNGSFESMSASLVVARRVKVMMTISGVIQMVSILLGAALVLMLTVLNSMAQFSAPILCGYLLLWLGVDLLIQKLVRI
ncbi:MAG: hypothetical protein ACOX6P_07285 [Candidatus Merdivicinus sp.]